MNKIKTGRTSNLERELNILKRHIKVLKIVKREEPIGIHRLSEITGLPAHKVRYSLRILEDEEIIKPTMKGAVLHKKIEEYTKHFQIILKKILAELEVLKDDLIA